MPARRAVLLVTPHPTRRSFPSTSNGPPPLASGRPLGPGSTTILAANTSPTCLVAMGGGGRRRGSARAHGSWHTALTSQLTVLRGLRLPRFRAVSSLIKRPMVSITAKVSKYSMSETANVRYGGTKKKSNTSTLTTEAATAGPLPERARPRPPPPAERSSQCWIPSTARTGSTTRVAEGDNHGGRQVMRPGDRRPRREGGRRRCGLGIFGRPWMT